LEYRGPYCGDDFAQKFPQAFKDEAQVVADGAHDGVELVAEAAFEEVSAKMAVGFAMAEGGFDGGPPPQFASDLAMDAAFRARFEEPGGLCRIVAT